MHQRLTYPYRPQQLQSINIHLPAIVFDHAIRLSDQLSRVAGQFSLRSISLILLVFVSRLGFLPGNISPLGSYGFFSHWGLYFVSIVAFDRFIGGSYSGFWWTYLGFAAYPLFGWLYHRLEQRAKSSLPSNGATRSTRSIQALQWLLIPSASFAFFVLSNFGVWLHWYPHTLDGILTCYALAIPFYVRTLIGDLTFGWGTLIASSLYKKRHHLSRFSLFTHPSAILRSSRFALQ